jgi:mRNA interferase MazF
MNKSATPDDKEPPPPPRIAPSMGAAPKIRQVLWCDFWKDVIQPEMWKRRPVVVMSYKNTLSGPCLVLPTSTDPQQGLSARWAHKLSVKLDGQRESWVVCNHLYTVSPSRLYPTNPLVRLEEAEFNAILARMLTWLPKLPS